MNRQIYKNGNIYVGSHEERLYHFMIAENGRIEALGFAEEFEQHQREGTQVIDLEGRFVLPGFIDSHVHFTQTGLEQNWINAAKAESVEELLTAILQESKKKSQGEAWITAVNFNERNLKERRFPTVDELERTCAKNPVFIIRSDEHACMINKMAWTILHMEQSPQGYDVERGICTGKANAYARMQFFEMLTREDRLRAHRIAEQLAIQKGVTYLNALEGGNSLFSDKDVAVLKENMKQIVVGIRIYQQTLDVERVLANDFQQLGGCITLDGSLGSHTAALLEPYEDDMQNKGILYYSDEEVQGCVKAADANELQVTMHCIGDGAIQQLFNAYKPVLAGKSHNPRRHRIEHFSVPSEEQIAFAAENHLIVSVQPAFDYYDKNHLYEERLGISRACRVMPLRAMLDRGVLLAGGSDSPVTELNPILGIHAAVNLKIPGEAITVREAIDLFTINGAYASFQEEERGTLERGKVADFVVLSHNILEVPHEEIRRVHVHQTYIRGEMVYAEGEQE